MPPGDLNRLLQDYAARIEKNTKRIDRLETLEFSSAAFPAIGGIVCLETLVLGAPAASVTLLTAGPIPATWYHLWLWYAGRSTGLEFQPLLGFNADAGTNYYSYKNSWFRTFAPQDGVLTVGGIAKTTRISLPYVSSTNLLVPAENFLMGGGEVNIYDYAGDQYKLVTHKGWAIRQIEPEDSFGPIVYKTLGGGNWLSTTPITSLSLSSPGPSSFDTGSIFTLMAVCPKAAE